MIRLFVSLVLLAPVVAAAGPVTLRTSGRVADSGGGAPDGLVQITFTLWDQATGGTDFHAETIQVDLQQGYYTAVLGAMGDLLASEIPSTGVWIQTQVGGTDFGRTPAGFVPLAAVADSVRGGTADVSSVSIGGTTVIDGDRDLIARQATLEGPVTIGPVAAAAGQVHVESTGPTVVHIAGDQDGYINAAVRLEAKDDGSAYRGLGTFAYDNTSDTEWFWGRPYAGSDYYTILRQQGFGAASDTTSDVCPDTVGGGGCGEPLMLLSPRGELRLPSQPDFFAAGSSDSSSNTGYEPYVPSALVRNNCFLADGTTPCLSLSTGKFTAPIDGVYHFSWVVLIDGVDTGAFVDPTYRVETTGHNRDYFYGPRMTFQSDYVTGGDDYLPLSGSTTVFLQAGGQFWVNVGTASGAWNFHVNPGHWAHLTGALLH